MKKSLVVCLIVCLLALELPAPVFAGSVLLPPGRTVSVTSDGLLVNWQTPQLQTLRQADGTSALSMDGFASVETPGQPRLPQDSFLVALPPGANPILEMRVGGTAQFSAPPSIARVPGSVTVPGNAGDQVFDLSQPSRQMVAPVTLDEIGVMRGVRLARLTFQPVRLENGQMQVTLQVTAKISYGASDLSARLVPAETISRDATLSTLSGAVVNPSQLAPSAPETPSSIGLVDRAGQVAIEVSAPGLTAVTRQTLFDAGFPVATVDPRYLHLEWNGVEIPTEWDGDDDALFETGEQLLFYAQPRFSRWTARDVYFLSASATPRQAMLERTNDSTGIPVGSLWIDQLFEQNKIYTPDCYCAPIPAGRDGDRWVWDVLHKPDRASADYSFSLASVDTTQSAKITLWMIGYTDVPLTTHNVQVQLNGTVAGTLVFEGKQANPPDQATLTLPPGVLKTGGNTLTLTLLANGALVDGIWLDAFSIHFARGPATFTVQEAVSGLAAASQYTVNVAATAGLRAYDVTDPAGPIRLPSVTVDSIHALLSDPLAGLPRRYALVPFGAVQFPDAVRMVTPLQAHKNAGARYIMLTPSEFAPDLADLVSLRQGQGLSVIVEDVRAIYDAVDGRPQPEAIRAYLANAYAHWTTRPEFVLLVGDGTSDPRRYKDTSSITWIPPFLADADPVIGEIAADNRYVAVDGNDVLPDMWIGRLPVNSHVEAAITITKIVQYARNTASSPWSRRMLLVSDKNDPSVGNFTVENEALAAAYGNGRYEITQLEYETAASLPVFHQSVLDSWNRGNGLIIYNGHASTHQWGSDPLFHLNDLPAVVNGNRLPVLLDMTCLTGSFQVPDVPTLDETLLRRSGKGVVAAWGSTGLGLSSGHMLLAHGFLDQLKAEPGSSIGKAAALAKLSTITTAPALEYLLDTFTLLGDPAMSINYRYDTYLPVVRGVKP